MFPKSWKLPELSHDNRVKRNNIFYFTLATLVIVGFALAKRKFGF